MKTFKLTRAQFEALRGRMAADGHSIKGDAGAIEAQNVKLKFAYDEAAKALTVDIAHKPMLVPEAMVWSKINGWIGEG